MALRARDFTPIRTPEEAGDGGADFSLVHFAPVRNVHHGYGIGFGVDDVDYTPVTYSNAPLIFETLELLASFGPWIVGQR